MAALLCLELVLTNLFLLFQVLLFVGLDHGGTVERKKERKKRQNIATIKNFEIFRFIPTYSGLTCMNAGLVARGRG